MLANILSPFKGKNAANGNYNEGNSRRRYSRRDSDRCIACINDNVFPVNNWSIGGVQIACDDRNYAIGQQLAVTLKFQLNDNGIETTQLGQVVRKGKHFIGIEFQPIDQETRKKFQLVVDNSRAE